MPRSLGLDVHQATIYVTIADPDSGLESFEVPVDEPSLGAFERQLRPDDRIALEATTNAYYFYDRFSPLVAEVALANPVKLRRYLGDADKSDRNDSHWLAMLNFFGCLPTVWVPDQEIRELRELVSHRGSLIRERTRCQNQIRSFLARHGLVCPASDLKRVPVQEVLRRLGTRLSDTAQVLLNARLAQLGSLEARLEPIEALMAERAAGSPEAQLLMSIPGLAEDLSLTIVAAIGTVERFAKPKSLVNYAGLAPRENASGTRRKTGRIKRSGSRLLRWAVSMAVRHLIHQPGRFRNMHRRLLRKGNGIAMVACARKLLTLIWRMLKTGERYRELTVDLRRRKKARSERRLGHARRALAERKGAWKEQLERHAALLTELSTGRVGLPFSVRAVGKHPDHLENAPEMTFSG